MPSTYTLVPTITREVAPQAADAITTKIFIGHPLVIHG